MSPDRNTVSGLFGHFSWSSLAPSGLLYFTFTSHKVISLNKFNSSEFFFVYSELPQKSGFVEEWKSCLEQRTLCIRQEGELLAGSHCNVGEEFVKQRICAAADDLWSLLESVFTGQQADRDGRDPGGLRPTTG